jgi:oligoribonuclease
MSDRATISPYLVWLDLEMTGLCPDVNRIIEIACVVTTSDKTLEVVAEGPHLIIHQPIYMLNMMDQWNTKQHTKTGLWKAVLASTISEAQAECQMLAFLAHYMKPEQSPLCGNTIWQDRRFLARYMPTLEAFFHYRLIDVSTLKELVKRWMPQHVVKKPHSTHRALQDILDTIHEMRYYQTLLFSHTS